jgi:hypothetical protein
LLVGYSIRRMDEMADTCLFLIRSDFALSNRLF